jgi:DNA-binding CsgD family transcriptional regulator
MSDRGSAVTLRQRQVAGLIAEGLTNQESAGRLGLASGTVSQHIANILWCLGLQRRREIAAWAIDRLRRARSP